MPGPAPILRELHRLRLHASRLQAEIDRAPRLIETQRKKVARQAELLLEAQDAIKKLKVQTHEKEVTLKTTYQQIAKHQKQLNEVESKKQYDALQLEIANDKKACEKLENEILEMMADTEERAAKIPELEKALQKAREEAAEIEKNAQSRHAGLMEQLNETLRQIKEVETTVPEAIRPHYQRLIASFGEDAMAAVQGRTCAACYTEITAQNYNELLMGQFVLCKSCGRMLYLPE